MPMVILGIDPGSRKTGYGILSRSGNSFTHIENGTLYLEKTENYAERLVVLFDSLQSLIQKYQVTELAVENIFYHKNPKTIQKLGEVRGVILLAGQKNGLNIGEYSALQVKQAVTGYGKATKDQMQVMVCKLLGLKDRAEENASDALGIALCHGHNQRQSLFHLKSQKTDVKTRQKQTLKKASFYR